MSDPGRRWRVLAWEDEEKIELRNRGVFDELVVDDWLHVEQMDDAEWWLQIGRDGHHLTVWVAILGDGTPQVALSEDETESDPRPTNRLRLRLRDVGSRMAAGVDGNDAVLPLPPVKWDRFGVRWVPSWVDGMLMWTSDDERMAPLTHRELAERGPFTEESDDE